MSQNYRHTQFGTVIVVAVGIGFGAAVVGLVLAGGPAAFTATFVGVFILTMALTSWMTVEVSDGQLRWWMGIGLISGSVRVNKIAEVQAVRNPWYYGWGMHLTRDGWLYNVSGTEAILVKTDDGKRFRLGTDEPQRLVEVVNEARKIG